MVAKHGEVYKLFTGSSAPMYVVCCDNPSDESFQKASHLLHELIGNCSMKTIGEPSEMQDIVELINSRQIFKEFGHLTIAVPPEQIEGDFLTAGVGIGSNSKKCIRAAKLALAVTWMHDNDTWMRDNKMTINDDPLIGSLDCGGDDHESGLNKHQTNVSGGCGTTQQHTSSSISHRPDTLSGRKRPLQLPEEWSTPGKERRISLPFTIQGHLPTTPRGSVRMMISPDGVLPPTHQEVLKEKKEKLAALMNECYEGAKKPWVLVWHPEKGSHYYWNLETRKLQWHSPQD